MRRLILFVLLSFSSVTRGGEFCDEVLISAHPNYPPFHWRQGDTLIGASIDVSVEILKSMGVPSVVRYEGPWKRVLAKADTGVIDLVPALKNTEIRRETLSFTNSPFYHNPVAIFVRNDFGIRVNSLSDLSSLRGNVNLGDSHGDTIDNFIRSKVFMNSVYGISSNFKMLISGRTDFFIEGFYTGNSYLKRNDLEDKIKTVKVFHKNWIYNAFSKHSPCHDLIKEFDKKLSLQFQSGHIENKIKEYEEIWLNTNL